MDKNISLSPSFGSVAKVKFRELHGHDPFYMDGPSHILIQVEPFLPEVIACNVSDGVQIWHRYRDLEEMMEERGIVDRLTLYRWVQRYAPKWKNDYNGIVATGSSWRVDETYFKGEGVWKYYYRAVDEQGRTLVFISPHAVPKPAKRFLNKALKLHKHYQPSIINTDKILLTVMLFALSRKGILNDTTVHRQVQIPQQSGRSGSW